MLEGTRAGETLDLDWRDVYLETSWAVIRDTKDNEEDRGIALHPQIAEMLSRVPAVQRVGKVFKTANGKAYAEADGGGRGKTGWNATKVRAGVERLRFHDIRHTFATHADEWDAAPFPKRANGPRARWHVWPLRTCAARRTREGRGCHAPAGIPRAKLP